MTNQIVGMGLAATMVVGMFAGGASAQEAKKKVLFLTKSEGFEHSVIARKKETPEKLSFAEQVLVEFAAKKGYEVTCTKDAKKFVDEMGKYDVLAFYTTGNLTKDSKDGGAGMTPEQKEKLLSAIKDGKGVIGFHSATDTFHGGNKVDGFTTMMGGEFLTHQSQQKAWMHVAFKFPGLEDLKDYEMLDEWYANKNVNAEMTAILVQDTLAMRTDKGVWEKAYQRPMYPATWALMSGNGRVFYTSMGHREDVWTSATFQKVVIAGLDWVAGKTNVELTPNLAKVAPGYDKTTIEIK